MSKIKVAELFYSIQGEGRYSGVPSIFLRTFGCNFRCPGFGMPRGEKTKEVDKIIENLDQYKTFSSLPLVSTGCDSYSSIYPAFKNLSPMVETGSIVSQILELLPFKKWVDEHLVITGGEPLLGWQKSYPDLLDNVYMQHLKELTFETNGTQNLSEDFCKYLEDWTKRAGRSYNSLTFSVSPKLPVSGEKWEEAIRPEIIAQYETVGYTYLKFVVASEQDAADALKATEEYRKAGFSGPVYLMPVGGVESVYQLNNRAVAELAMKHGLRYSDRLQVPLFKNAWAT